MADYVIVRSDDYLAHHGVKGQKHGVRQYQNEDGSLTELGREHYGVGANGERLKKKNRYEFSDGSLTKAGMKERSRMEKWYNSDKGKSQMRFYQSRGFTKQGAYSDRRVAGATFIGTMLAGPAAGIIAGLVTTRRMSKGSDFIQRTLGELETREKESASA